MERYVYIKKNSSLLPFVEFTTPLSSEEFQIGETWDDYINGKWILLNDEQVAFHEEHPTATRKEVFDMRMKSDEETLEQAIQEKIREIIIYDESAAVNSFSINGQQMWLTFDERSRLRAAVEAKKKLGRDTMTKSGYTFTLEQWEGMLATLEEYANDCADVTEGHKATVARLSSKEELNNYDYTEGYPQQLIFSYD